MKSKKSLIIISLIVAWLGLLVVSLPYFSRTSEVSSNTLADFLPKSAEATIVNQKLKDFRDSSSVPLMIVFSSVNSLSDIDLSKLNQAVDTLNDSKVTSDEIPSPVISEDEKSALLIVPISLESNFDEIIPMIREIIEKSNVGLEYNFAGPALFVSELDKAFAKIDGMLLLVTLGVVLVILLIVYRSPILPIITLLGAVIALSVALLVVWHLANNNFVQLNSQVQGILFILVIGATTDYSLLYISRYREELMVQPSAIKATKVALKSSWESIVAAGGTVSLGLLCLLASDLGSNKALGPVGGIGIAFAVLVALTFLPAVLLLIGKRAFWPREPKITESPKADSYRLNHSAWAKIGDIVGKYPRPLWLSSIVILAIACLFIPQFKASGVEQTDLLVGASEAREGQEVLAKHFPSGAGMPLYVIAPEASQDKVIKMLDSDDGVEAVSILVTDKAIGSAPVGLASAQLEARIRQRIENGQNIKFNELRAELEQQAIPSVIIDKTLADARAQAPPIEDLINLNNPYNQVEPKVVNGKVALEATINQPATSSAAFEIVKRLRSQALEFDGEVLIGGQSAIQLDTNTAANRDLRVVMPLILIVITIILMLLLRSIVAPVMLLLLTLLSFGATIGISALLFNHVWGYPGSDPIVPLYSFVFLVALGIDYNIFLMTRVREESKLSDIKSGTLKALIVTGGVISSAGIVLAATFASLYVIPILFLVQIAFIVAFGVLMDTLLVRTLVVPSLTIEAGRFIWWPSKLRKKD